MHRSAVRRRVLWSEYLSAFNIMVCFRPGKLGEKPDPLTCRVYYYLNGGGKDYTLANPQICAQYQLATSLVFMTWYRAQLLWWTFQSLYSMPQPSLKTSKLAFQSIPDKTGSRLCLKGSPSPCFSLSFSGPSLMGHSVYILDF